MRHKVQHDPLESRRWIPPADASKKQDHDHLMQMQGHTPLPPTMAMAPAVMRVPVATTARERERGPIPRQSLPPVTRAGNQEGNVAYRMVRYQDAHASGTAQHDRAHQMEIRWAQAPKAVTPPLFVSGGVEASQTRECYVAPGNGRATFDIEARMLGSAPHRGTGLVLTSKVDGKCSRSSLEPSDKQHAREATHVAGKENRTMNASLVNVNDDESSTFPAPAASHTPTPAPMHSTAIATRLEPMNVHSTSPASTPRGAFPRHLNDFIPLWPNRSQASPSLSTEPTGRALPFAPLRERSASTVGDNGFRINQTARGGVARERRSISFTTTSEISQRIDPLVSDLRRSTLIANAQDAAVQRRARANSCTEATSGSRRTFPKKCDFPLCKNSARSRGFCYSHGGGRRCRIEGCPNGAVSRDLCKRHGGGRRCRVEGCKSSSESGGLCYSHGGGKRCSLSSCTARAKKGGYCAQHQQTRPEDGEKPGPAAEDGLNHFIEPSGRQPSGMSTIDSADAAETKDGQQEHGTTSSSLKHILNEESSPVDQVRPRSRSLSIAALLN